jgi:hypothetical protein
MHHYLKTRPLGLKRSAGFDERMALDACSAVLLEERPAPVVNPAGYTCTDGL